MDDYTGNASNDVDDAAKLTLRLSFGASAARSTSRPKRTVKPTEKVRAAFDILPERQKLFVKPRVHNDSPAPEPVLSVSSMTSRSSSPPPPPIPLEIDYGAWEVPFSPEISTTAERVEQYRRLQKCKPKFPLTWRDGVMLLKNQEWRHNGRVMRRMEWPSESLASDTRSLWITLELPGRSHGESGFLEYFLVWDQARRDEESLDRSEELRQSESELERILRKNIAGTSLEDSTQATIESRDKSPLEDPSIADTRTESNEVLPSFGMDGTTDDPREDDHAQEEKPRKTLSWTGKGSVRKTKVSKASLKKGVTGAPTSEGDTPTRQSKRIILKLSMKSKEQGQEPSTPASTDHASAGRPTTPLKVSPVDTPIDGYFGRKSTPLRPSSPPSSFHTRTRTTPVPSTSSKNTASSSSIAAPSLARDTDRPDTAALPAPLTQPHISTTQDSPPPPTAPTSSPPRGLRSLLHLAPQYTTPEVFGPLSNPPTPKSQHRTSTPNTPKEPQKPVRGLYIPIDESSLHNWKVPPGTTDAFGVPYTNDVYVLRTQFPPKPILKPSFLVHLSQLRAHGFTALESLVVELEGFALRKGVDAAFMRLLDRWLKWLCDGIERALGMGGIKVWKGTGERDGEDVVVKMLGVPMVVGVEG
ncbi:hypothetical protein EJ05DRAFT_495872 [Pseudovirgaria hyperparasitica]|uniref:Uncharacterized protein n=1 Tax=Pseudovirgaria hyperparasitica TaxID=470096 RepID=A0A6A6WLD8_9PEZI|nr:uncharacterized protein EJ05DRAFT_495872 [Pseudovirgaria hyperparasitica]KAF2763030.1 hypothetical protein EJ05DRAFT_495872 [Pseudovirgaria hyperparasitica]